MMPAARVRRLARSAARPAVVALGVLLLLAPLVAFLVLDRLFPFPFEALERPPARVVRARDGEPLRIFLPADGRYRFPVRLDEVSPVMVETLVASEDRWFWWHPGVNPLAIGRAAIANLRAGEVVSGASTIPMQIARLADPKPRRLAGKIEEAFRALQLEWHLDKRRILELYLDMAPFGGNVEGVGAATWSYFGKRPSELSVGEAALLTALPRSPRNYDPVEHPHAAAAARGRVLAQLRGLGLVSEEAIADAARQPVPRRRRAAPFLAAHAARRVAAATVGRHDVTATIDAQTQRLLEQRLASHAEGLRREGLDNAAVVVLDVDTRAVLAYAGSAAFFDAAHQGQVDGAASERSPGSTLKPFLYAMAIDAGRAHPAGYLLDVPTDFAGYVAENYDGSYRGEVTTAEALRLSLNAPAVRLLARVGLTDYLTMLRRGGLATLDRPPSDYGLPLVLGAGEVRLLDLTNLYATLAAGGVHRPVRLHDGAPAAEGMRLLSAASSWLVAEILREVERPDLPDAWRLTRDAPAVAWKTGTSYGHRDAWAVGTTRRLAIGVWVGNPDGRAQKGISGAHHAAPLLFDLARALDGDGRAPTRPPGIDLGEARLCSESHQLAGPYCPATIGGTVVPGVTRLRGCEVHRRIFVDAASGERLAGACLRRVEHRAAVVSVKPAELVAWLQAQGHDVEQMPPLSAACTDVPAAERPRIVSPVETTPYLVRADAPTEHQRIALTARAAPRTQRLYWYQDGELVAAGPPGAPLFVAPTPGEHELVVVDDAGRADRLRYRVE